VGVGGAVGVKVAVGAGVDPGVLVGAGVPGDGAGVGVARCSQRCCAGFTQSLELGRVSGLMEGQLMPPKKEGLPLR